jgi:surface protein
MSNKHIPINWFNQLGSTRKIKGSSTRIYQHYKRNSNNNFENPMFKMFPIRILQNNPIIKPPAIVEETPIRGTLSYSFNINYTGTSLEQTIRENLPIHSVSNVFSISDINVSIDDNNQNITVTITTNLYASKIKETNTSFGITFDSVKLFYNNNTTNLTIISGSNVPFSKKGNQFAELLSLTISHDFIPYILEDTSLFKCFYNCVNFNSNISNWNTSNVTNMSHMFSMTPAFNQPLTNFDTSNVTDMTHMFFGARTFNQQLTNFNTLKVINMSHMFYVALAFNQSLSNFNTSNVTDMSAMFYFAQSFNQPLTNFDTSNVTNMSHMFYECTAFNQPLTNFDTSNVTNMSAMFYNVIAFNQSLTIFDTSKVTNMSYMFYSAVAFNQPLTHFDTSKVTNMSYMFTDARSFKQNISTWNISELTNATNMFANVNINETGTTTNYDALLTVWSSQSNIRNSVSFHGGLSKYSSGVLNNRNILTNSIGNGGKGWIITDGGMA